MLYRLLHILGVFAFVLALVPAAAPAVERYRLHVVGEKGEPMPRFQAMLYAGKGETTGWIEGKEGEVSFPAFRRDPPLLRVLARADNYAATVLLREGAELEKIRRGDATTALSRGEKVQLRFCLPPEIGLPETILPGVYYDFCKEEVYRLRRSAHQLHPEQPDLKLIAVNRTAPDRYEVRLARSAPAFYVGLRAHGFRLSCDMGPFTLADERNGVLEIPVPGPAGLNIHFDPGAVDAEKLPFQGVFCEVMWKIPGHGDSMQPILEQRLPTVKVDLRVTDLRPGDYLVSVRTSPKPGVPVAPNAAPGSESGSGINPGAYYDRKIVSLKRGQMEHVNFHFTPLEPDAYRGRRTAILRVEQPNGTPAAGTKIIVSYLDGHYGALPVFSGEVPSSGEVTLRNLTDRKPSLGGWNRGHYSIRTEDHPIGFFDFAGVEPTERFVFHLPLKAGDMAPDVKLLDVASGKNVNLRELRGKVVCLEFWASWCGPCQPAMEKLDSLAQQHADDWKRHVLIAPVSIDQTVEIVKKHITERGWNHLTHYWTGDGDHAGFDSSAMRAFVGSGVPESILIGSNGRIFWRGHPMDDHDGQDLKARIEAAMKQ